VTGRVSRRDFLRSAASALSLPALLAACSKGEDQKTVNFFNWSKYIGKDTLPRFARETGVKVNYDEFADEEEMFAKLRSGARGYDMIVGTDYMIPRFKTLNIIDAFPTGLLKNLGNIDPRFRDPIYDPKLEFTVPYLWGTTGIAYNKTKLAKPPTSWADLWDEKFAGKVSMLDNARDCIGVALQLKGLRQDTKEPKDFETARDFLIKQRPLVKSYSSSAYMDSLLTGEIHLAMAWSGDAMQVARENPAIDYVIPKEGGFLWVDSLCLVRGSEHREDTLRLVDYLLEPDVAADIANTVRYATPNAACMKLLDKALVQDKRVFPAPDVMKRLKFHDVLDPEASELWNSTWSDVKVS
jgi:spermidine/putrescine-binding protein